jgi:hypothetical protein
VTQVPPEYESAPSWVPPIMIGALVTVLAQFAANGIGSAAPGCCCGLALPLGVLASFLAYKRDPNLTPGQGFTVAFIACGLGSALTAFILIMEMTPEMRAEFVDQIRESAEQFNEQADPAQKLAPEDIDRLAETAGQLVPYVPPIGALVCTLLSAFSGLLAVLVMRGRQPPRPLPEDAL